MTEVGGVDLQVPRDRNGSFTPRIVRKGQTRLEGFNDRIIALCARGLSTRGIRAHLREMYDVDVSPDLISRVTDGVLEELQEWQSRRFVPAGCAAGAARLRRGLMALRGPTCCVRAGTAVVLRSRLHALALRAVRRRSNGGR